MPPLSNLTEPRNLSTSNGVCQIGIRLLIFYIAGIILMVVLSIVLFVLWKKGKIGDGIIIKAKDDATKIIIIINKSKE